VIWNCAELVTLCVNKRGIHPGANLGMDIALWLGCMLNGIFSFLLVWSFDDTIFGAYIAGLSFFLLARLAFIIHKTLFSMLTTCPKYPAIRPLHPRYHYRSQTASSELWISRLRTIWRRRWRLSIGRTTIHDATSSAWLHVRSDSNGNGKCTRIHTTTTNGTYKSGISTRL
jgi:hypothetical protein